MTLRDIMDGWHSFAGGSLDLAFWRENWLDAELQHVFGAIAFYILMIWLFLKFIEKAQAFFKALVKGEAAIYKKSFWIKVLKIIGIFIGVTIVMMGLLSIVFFILEQFGIR